MAGPPAALVRSLVEGPSAVSAVEWHEVVASTQAAATDAARAGAPEIHVVLADVQTAGRGRLGRSWHAPPGTSLLASLVLRPAAAASDLPLLPLLAGVALAEVAERYCAGVGLKWPNDLLVDGRKAGGILAESDAGAVVLGAGVNVDWRAVTRPADAGDATSLTEARAGTVDRWRVLAAFLGVFGRRYHEWKDQPRGFLDDYRRRCTTLGQRVRVVRVAAPPLEGTAREVADDGGLVIDAGETTHRVTSGDVEHLRLRP